MPRPRPRSRALALVITNFIPQLRIRQRCDRIGRNKLTLARSEALPIPSHPPLPGRHPARLINERPKRPLGVSLRRGQCLVQVIVLALLPAHRHQLAIPPNIDPRHPSRLPIPRFQQATLGYVFGHVYSFLRFILHLLRRIRTILLTRVRSVRKLLLLRRRRRTLLGLSKRRAAE